MPGLYATASYLKPDLAGAAGHAIMGITGA